MTSVIHRYAKASAVVLEVIVVHAQIQPSRRSHPDGAVIVADEEVIVGIANPADQRRRRPARNRPGVVARRVPFAGWTVLPIRSPANTAASRKVQRLTGANVDAGIFPTQPRVDADLALPKP